MTKKEFNKLKFSQRHVISKGIKCSASWQVQQVGGDAGYFISCRECGTMLQSDCTPKCLLHETPPTEINTMLKHSIMQAVSEKQPYFKLSTNEFGKHWLFYKPLKSEPGKYSCWMPIDDEFYSEFDRMQKAALGSEAAVGQRSVGQNVSDGCKRTALCDENPTFGYCSHCGGKF